MQPFEEEKDVSFKRPSACFIILAVATFVLLVISIVFITLYALEKSKSSETQPTARPRVPEQKYCGTRACFETSKGKPADISYVLKGSRNSFCTQPDGNKYL